jgi:hypothetical protein
MSDQRDRPDDEPADDLPFVREWTPATSKPGELYTVEGQIESIGAFARGLTNDDPRGATYRKGMVRHALMIIGGGIALVVAFEVIASLF